MRAKEFIIEGPFDTVKTAANTATSIGAQLKGGFDQGYKKMDKILSPSKWGQDKEVDSNTAEFVPHTARDVMARASTGQKLYNDDIATITSLRGAISKGVVKTKQDPAALNQALKALAQTKVADKNQAAMFAALSKEI
jgi:hypothetical protein